MRGFCKQQDENGPMEPDPKISESFLAALCSLIKLIAIYNHTKFQVSNLSRLGVTDVFM